MSEHITHIAVYEDSARLLLNTDRFCTAFRSCIKKHYDTGLFTSGSRGNHIYAVPFLEQNKDTWNEHQAEGKQGAQIAAAVGWITHRASDRQMKPIWRSKKEADPGFNDTEMQVYQDSVTFREVYSNGKISTESPYELITPHTLEKHLASHPAASLLDSERVEELISFLYQKEFVELQKFHKTGTEVDKWMDDFIEYHQEFTEDLRIYIEAFSNPDPAKMKINIYDINYYNAEDPLIRWVRGIQHGRDVSEIDLDEALEAAADQSQYAQAIRKSYIFMLDASDFFMNRLEKETLYDTLDMPANQRP